MSQIHGVGVDIVECLRIAQMIERHGEAFLNRVYSTHEIEYCRARNMATQHFAGRWAAKEAIVKALGSGLRYGLRWRDIEIHNDHEGKPAVGLRGLARDHIEKLGVSQVLVSISHCRTHAMAYAMAIASEDRIPSDE